MPGLRNLRVIVSIAASLLLVGLAPLVGSGCGSRDAFVGRWEGTGANSGLTMEIHQEPDNSYVLITASGEETPMRLADGRLVATVAFAPEVLKGADLHMTIAPGEKDSLRTSMRTVSGSMAGLSTTVVFQRAGSSATPSTNALTDDEVAYVEAIVQGSRTLALAQSLADAHATALSNHRPGGSSLRRAIRLSNSLTEKWFSTSGPVPPSAHLKSADFNWHQALYQTVRSMMLLSRASTQKDYDQKMATMKRGISYRKNGFKSLAEAAQALRSLTAGSSIPGLTADLGANPYSWGDNAGVSTRKSLWREYLAAVLIENPDGAKVTELIAQFDDTLTARRAERLKVDDWYAAAFKNQ